jgi:hypothetical protein
MARGTTKGKRSRRVPGGGWATLPIVLGTVLVVAAAPLCLVLAAGMVPTVAAALVDTHPRRFLTRAVGAVNLSGVVLPVLALVHGRFGFSQALHVLGEPRNWIIMFGAAGLGWVLVGVTPPIARVILDMRAHEAERRLRREEAQLAAEWTGDLRGR